MNTLKDYLKTIDDDTHRDRFSRLLNTISEHYPLLSLEIKWNQPMFVSEGCFVIAFSASKHHFSVAPEVVALEHFKQEIKDRGYVASKKLFRIKWSDEIQMELLYKIISFNIKDRKGSKTFWRSS